MSEQREMTDSEAAALFLRVVVALERIADRLDAWDRGEKLDVIITQRETF